MSRKSLAPFLYELRETTATAQFRYAELEAAAERWRALDAESDALMQADDRKSNDEAFAAVLVGSQKEQLHMFEALEAFLAAWARVSLLLFPTSGNARRGSQLRAALELTHEEVLKDRKLRDSWMHFDERLDEAVAAGGWGNRHKWVRASAAPVALPHTLRLFDVDNLVIYYRDQRGHALKTGLRLCKDALTEIAANWQGAWSRVQ